MSDELGSYLGDAKKDVEVTILTSIVILYSKDDHI